ncbi:antibiotic biosynthesis monooxygenase [Psychromonas algarum]|uniref:antibiotic biosynthesis monooxygenase n=1 Tax=Psychromonas algarum TaxID=2555643 RepID=UPI001419C475|nr:antibiotic biosynthesis monooxygenase [Psychromonas sp. RZ22]
MYTVLYQWKIKEDKKDEFIASWNIVTDHYVNKHGQIGSRLHEITDNTFAAYAQWESEDKRNKAFALDDVEPEVLSVMESCIVKTLKPIEMHIVSDKLKA